MNDNNEVLVRVENVSKKFCRSLKKSLWYGVCDMAHEVNPFARKAETLKTEKLKSSADFSMSDFQRVSVSKDVSVSAFDPALRPGEFWAVNDVSFELRRGECLGLIGRNGAGKTTLLKMLNGLIKPDAGTITMRGRVGALIALGAGFNPILTGRENIYVNGSVLGLTKREIDAKIEDIIDFAEIREFIDSPVQSYSSGMQVRLGFAVATAMEPDVLIIDEVLAVGDVAFRSKCYDRLEKVRANTATILVSHNRHDIMRTCTRGLFLTGGRTIFQGGLVETFSHYENSFGTAGSFVHRNADLELLSAKFDQETIRWGDCVTLKVCIKAASQMENVSCRVSIMDMAEWGLAEWRSENHMGTLNLKAGDNVFEFKIGSVQLQSGVYYCNLIFSKPNHSQYLLLAYRHLQIKVAGEMNGLHAYQL